jgi:hypothetical protein
MTPKVVPPRKKQPWERLTNETDLQFAAFQFYIGLGLERTVAGAYRLYVLHADVSKLSKKRIAMNRVQVPHFFSDWVSIHNWAQRAKLWDEHLIRMEEDAVRTRVEEKADLWIKRRDEQREQLWGIGEAMLNQAKEMLEYPITLTRKIAGANQTIIQPVKWYDKQVAATLAKAGCELTSRALGDVRPEDTTEDVTLNVFDRLIATDEKAANQ